MNLTFHNPGVQAMIDSIMQFQTEGETPYWSEPLFYFFPGIDKGYFKKLSLEEKKQYLTGKLTDIYAKEEANINQKVLAYRDHWNKCRPQIEEALSDAFQLDLKDLFNDLRVEICLNPISPRFLREKYFEVFYLNSERGAIGVSIHEIIHFVWFYVWNQIFKDSYDEYERPSLKWILSEMVV